jgi:hypothetical protein
MTNYHDGLEGFDLIFGFIQPAKAGRMFFPAQARVFREGKVD